MPIRDQTTLKLLLSPQAFEALGAEGITLDIDVHGPADLEDRLARALARIAGGHERIESLAALGQVGAGVTHEVRNVMTGVLGFVQVAKKKLTTQPQKAEELLVLIDKESQRCLEILTNFLNFSRPRQPEHKPLDLADALMGVAKLVHHQLHMRKVKMEVEVAPDLPVVMGDGAALKQVLLNLVMNALQAMDDRGGLVRLTGQRSRDGRSAVLQVIDNGPGVPPELAKQIFDPFFTTKPIGQGTGMGLAVSRSLVEQQGGTLSLESSTRSGATFTVRLPTVAP